MIRETEVVIGTKEEDFATVQHDPRPLAPLDAFHVPVEPLFPEAAQIFGKADCHGIPLS